MVRLSGCQVVRWSIVRGQVVTPSSPASSLLICLGLAMVEVAINVVRIIILLKLILVLRKA